MNAKLRISACVRILLYLLTVTCCAVPLQAVAGSTRFIRIEGDNGIVLGDSVDDNHKDWSDVVDYGQTLTNPGNKLPGCKSVITKVIDSASPFLWTLTANKILLKKAIFEAEAVGDSRNQPVLFRATMQNVKVSEVINNTSITSNIETITLLPQTINFEVYKQDSSGKVGITPITANITCTN